MSVRAQVIVPVVALEMQHEEDVVLARQRARQLAGLLGFDVVEQTGIATAVSELARNAFRYAGGGRVELAIAREADDAPRLLVRVRDRGPGIADLAAVLEGRYVSQTGMGLGLVGARRLSDEFHVETAPGAGTTVTLTRRLPARAEPVTMARIAAMTAELARATSPGALGEVQAQNQELLRALGDLRERQQEIERLNRELEETNRGVLALYAELEDTADALRLASNQKSRFLSSVSHELRTPLSSMLNLSRMLVEYSGERFGEEQRRQAQFIRKSAQALYEIVNDLLDLAKIEAGRVEVRPVNVDVAELLGTLRGVFRPLLPPAVALVVDPPPPEFALFADEGKLAQILRNFLSNAVKYTERGEIRLRAEARPEDRAAFVVRDTGIGIAPEDQRRIFEEFTQVEGPHQTRVKGTGLGLSLSRRFAELLDGAVTLESAPGEGSTFTLVIPRRWRAADAAGATGAAEAHA